MTVITNNNNIVVSGDFNFDCMQRSCAALHNLRRSGYTSIMVDLSEVTACFAGSMLPFILRCKQARHNEVDVAIIVPKIIELSQLFVNSNWLNMLEPETSVPSSAIDGRHIPAILFKDADSHFKAVDIVVNRLLGIFRNLNRDQFAALEWVINEITDNILNHADSDIGGVIQLTTKQKSKIIEIVVCDVGLGIPKTLKEAHSEIVDDLSALDMAIREGVTRNRATNMGNGLFGSYAISQLSGGYFSIYSGYATLEFNPKAGGLRIRKQNIPFFGTAISCGIGTEDPELLLKALSFDGKPHIPGYSLLDRIEDSGERIDISLKAESLSFGSREVANRVRTKIENIMKMSTKTVRIDLDGIPIVSSSYADEIFGKLLEIMGMDSFKSKVEIVGGNVNVNRIISRALWQRAGRP